MRKHGLFSALALLASSLVIAEPLRIDPLPEALAGTLHKTFADSRLIARSPACRSDPAGPAHIGLVVEQAGRLHAVVAVADRNWVLWDLPRKVANERGMAADFLGDFSGSRFDIAPRCTSPANDPDINVANNGLSISHRGEGDRFRHVCFPASDVYNSWVCYWVEPGTVQPLLSFVQFNAD